MGDSRQPSAVAIGWTAGILDGKGTIRVHSHSASAYKANGRVIGYVIIAVGNTDMKMLKRCKNFGAGP